MTIRTKPEASTSVPATPRPAELPRPAAETAPRNGLRRWEVKDVPARLTGATGFDSGPARTANTVAAPPVRIPVPGTYPLKADIDRIVAMEDPVARNHAITQGYHDVSNAVGELLGKENANWATFGVWASNQAGKTIRKEDAPKLFVDMLNGHEGVSKALEGVNQALRSVGLPTLPDVGSLLGRGDALMDTLSDAIADGNRMLFNDVGREFSNFVETFKGDTAYNPAKVEQYLSHFRPDQTVLKDAFANYALAQFEKNPEKKAELMLLANDQIGLHEQTQLQADVARALDAPIEIMVRDGLKDALENIAAKAGPFGSGKLLFKALEKTGVVDRVLGPLADAAGSVWRRAATEVLMKLTLPDGTELKLGQDVPGPKGGPAFPPGLERIENPTLRNLLKTLDRTEDSLQGSGAKDWKNLGDRMNFITDLFRAYQQDPALWKSPSGNTVSYSRPAPRVS